MWVLIMMWRNSNQRYGRPSIAGATLITSLWLAAFVAPWIPSGVASGEPSVGLSNTGSGVVRLSEPKGFAVLRHTADGRRSLYGPGEAISHPMDPLLVLMVEQIVGTDLVVRESPGGRRWVLQPGNLVPGFAGLVFAATARLAEIRYEFTSVEEVVDDTPLLLSLSGSMAVLRKEVLRSRSNVVEPPSSESPVAKKLLDSAAEQIEAIPVRQVGDHTYELEREDVLSVLGPMAELLTELSPVVTPALSVITGPVPISTEVGDGVLGRGGLTVTRLRVAQTFGVEVGDIIVSVNGREISTPLDAWWVLQETLIRNPRLSRARVNIVREGRLLTKTYRIN